MSIRVRRGLFVFALLLPSLAFAPALGTHGFTSIHAHDPGPNEVWAGSSMTSAERTLVGYATDDQTVKLKSWNYSASPFWDFEYMGQGSSAALYKPQYIDWGDIGCTEEECPCGIHYNLNSGHVSLYNMTFLNNAISNWYVGAGTPGANQIDLWSCITHEFGHWIRLSDLVGGRDPWCPGNSTDATMCSFYGISGTTKMRSISAEDMASVELENELCWKEEGICHGVPTRPEG